MKTVLFISNTNLLGRNSPTTNFIQLSKKTGENNSWEAIILAWTKKKYELAPSSVTGI